MRVFSQNNILLVCVDNGGFYPIKITIDSLLKSLMRKYKISSPVSWMMYTSVPQVLLVQFKDGNAVLWVCNGGDLTWTRKITLEMLLAAIRDDFEKQPDWARKFLDRASDDFIRALDLLFPEKQQEEVCQK